MVLKYGGLVRSMTKDPRYAAIGPLASKEKDRKAGSNAQESGQVNVTMRLDCTSTMPALPGTTIVHSFEIGTAENA